MSTRRAPASAVIASFRLGGGDGVSVEADKWSVALGSLGFHVRTVAGSGVADSILPGLAMDAQSPPSENELHEAFCAADLVVVENLCSLPLNPAAGRVVAKALGGRRALMHHHDLPWQRERFSEFPPPPDDEHWAHVTINQISRHQLARHGIRASTVRNTFDMQQAPGRREPTREAIGVGKDELLLLQPTRAIARKNVAGGLSLAASIGATFWLLGPAEDGYDAELASLLARARCRVIRGHAPGSSTSAMADVYAACDMVVLPSTWEGFGNPAIESAVFGRPLVVGPYPVAAELASFGFRWFALSDRHAIEHWVADRDDRLIEHNRSVARKCFSSELLPGRITKVLEEAGWYSASEGWRNSPR